jgi:NADPH-dependent ferric siderophore reductase
MGPAPGYQVDADAAWFLLLGDATSLPAIETILSELPAQTRARVLVEVENEGEMRELHSAAQLDVQWLSREVDSQQAGLPLENAVRTLVNDLPSGAGRIYVGCESAAMRRIRRLLKERGIDRSAMVTRGYWKLGSSNHPDGDYGDDAA